MTFVLIPTFTKYIIVFFYFNVKAMGGNEFQTLSSEQYSFGNVKNLIFENSFILSYVILKPKDKY